MVVTHHHLLPPQPAPHCSRRCHHCVPARCGCQSGPWPPATPHPQPRHPSQRQHGGRQGRSWWLRWRWWTIRGDTLHCQLLALVLPRAAPPPRNLHFQCCCPKSRPGRCWGPQWAPGTRTMPQVPPPSVLPLPPRGSVPNQQLQGPSRTHGRKPASWDIMVCVCGGGGGGRIARDHTVMPVSSKRSALQNTN
jgi:hypothetical protein